MSEKTQAILTVFALRYEQLMKSRLPSVTGKTKASVTSEVRPNRFLGYARGYVHALETGRGPRKSSEYSGFDDGLEDWLRAKGFPTKKTKKNTYYKLGDQWFTAKSLAWKINAKGDKTYRSGGKDVYSDALDRFMEELYQATVNQKHKEYTDQLMQQLGTLSNKAA